MRKFNFQDFNSPKDSNGENDHFDSPSTEKQKKFENLELFQGKNQYKSIINDISSDDFQPNSSNKTKEFRKFADIKKVANPENSDINGLSFPSLDEQNSITITESNLYNNDEKTTEDSRFDKAKISTLSDGKLNELTNKYADYSQHINRQIIEEIPEPKLPTNDESLESQTPNNKIFESLDDTISNFEFDTNQQSDRKYQSTATESVYDTIIQENIKSQDQIQNHNKQHHDSIEGGDSDNKGQHSSIALRYQEQQQQISDCLNKITQSLHELKSQIIDFLGHYREDVISMSYEIASKITECVRTYIPEKIVRDFLIQHLALLLDDYAVVIELNPSIKKPVQNLIKDELSGSALNNIEFIENPIMSIGDCTIKFAEGKIIKNKQLILEELNAILAHYMNSSNTV